jgi:histidine triad (HIT) family protein
MNFLIPLHRLRETAHLVAFYHPQPAYRLHILLVPRREVANFGELDVGDDAFMQDLVLTVQELVRDLDLESTGYRLIVNGGPYQEVKQLHFHLVSGPPLEAKRE